MTNPTPEAVRAVAQALTIHRTESVMTAEHCFGWQCLTCGAEGHSWPSIESAEEAALGHHAAAVLAFIRDAIHRDGPDADAIREILGLRDQCRHLCTCGGDWGGFSHTMSDRHEPRAPERRVVGEWQEVQP